MFAFDVQVIYSEIRRPYLSIKSPSFNGSFRPEHRLPQIQKIDAMAPKGALWFSSDSVVLKWDEKKVDIKLSAWGDDAGGEMEFEIPKIDDSLQQAVQDWIDFEKEENLLEQKCELINSEKQLALEAIKQKYKRDYVSELQHKEQSDIEKAAELQEDKLIASHNEAIIRKKQKTLH